MIIGNAKNARLKVLAISYEEGSAGFDVYMRGRKYHVDSFDDNADIKIMKGSKVISSVYHNTTQQVYTIEVIDSTFRVLNAAGTLLTSAIDTEFANTGNWEITHGNLVSFENLDQASKVRNLRSKGAEVKAIYSRGEPVKRVYSKGVLVWEA